VIGLGPGVSRRPAVSHAIDVSHKAGIAEGDEQGLLPGDQWSAPAFRRWVVDTRGEAGLLQPRTRQPGESQQPRTAFLPWTIALIAAAGRRGALHVTWLSLQSHSENNGLDLVWALLAWPLRRCSLRPSLPDRRENAKSRTGAPAS
jgi:hypothetical protein